MQKRRSGRAVGASALLSTALAMVLVLGQMQPISASPMAQATTTDAPVAGVSLATLSDRAVVETGIASWYGAELAGAPTASGEPFDPEAMTAAHPELPFGTAVTIVNLDNDRTVEVVINDRGPFTGDRVIDVSKAAARALGFKDDGTTEVRLEVEPEVLASAASDSL